jgi:integrase
MIWVSDSKGRRQVWGGTFKTKAEAKAAERQLLLDRDSGRKVGNSKITVAEICQLYLSEKTNKVKASTLQRSRELLNLLMPIIGSIRAMNLSPRDVSDAYNQLQKRLSKRTVRHAHWQLHGALELAVRWGLIPANVAARVEPPEPGYFEGYALDDDELPQLLEAMSGDPLAPLVLLAIDSAAREGELLALRWSEVDFEARTVYICRTVRKLKSGFLFSEPKTKNSRRTVEISDLTASVLRAHRERQNEKRLLMGDLWTEHDLVFPTNTGQPQTGSYVSKAFQKLAKQAGLEGLRFHDLRHSGVSLLLKSGEPMANVSRRAGHATIGVTVDTYGHQLGAGGSMAATMGTILQRSVRDPDTWLANG